MKILCVDDEPDILKLLTDYLVMCGHIVVSANNGEQALDLFSQEPDTFDLLLTDVRMPIMDGLDLLAAIRQLGHSVPVVLAAGHRDHEIGDAVKKFAIEDVLAKPFDLDDIDNILAKYQ